MSTTTLITSLLFLISVHSSDPDPYRECADSYQCSNKILTKAGPNKVACSGDNSCKSTDIGANPYSIINCTGHASCSQSPKLLASIDLYCSGYKSCYDASSQKANTIQCSGEEACAGSADGHLIKSGIALYCGAKKSCYRGLLSSGRRTYCDGLESCSGSTIKAEDDVKCNGQSSCYNAIISTPNDVVCGGKLSCEKATISNANKTSLYGDKSGTKVGITNVAIIEAYGEAALFQARIDSDSLSSMIVRVFGDSPDGAPKGLEALVKCRGIAECWIICKGSGCKGLELNCFRGSNCNIIPRECESNSNGNIQGIDCPKLTNKITKENVYNLNDGNSKMDVSRNDYTLKADATFCNKSASCVGQTISDDTIECGGYRSCRNGKVTVTEQKDGIIKCFGEESCLGSDLSAMAGNILCFGESSCAESTIHGDLVECKGYRSCQNTGGIDCLQELECSGTFSCKNTAIVNSLADVICSGDASCLKSDIETPINHDIYCNGNSGCALGILRSAQHTECDATKSCQLAMITPQKDKGSGNHLYVTSYDGARGADINGQMYVIRGSGYRSLSGSIIDTQDTPKIKVELVSHLAGYGAIIICRSGTECTLCCHTTACLDLQYLCETGAICKVSPSICYDPSIESHRGVDCPMMTTAEHDIIESILADNNNNNNNDIIMNAEEYDHVADFYDNIFDDDDEELFDDEGLSFGELEAVNGLLTNYGVILLGFIAILFIMSLFCVWKRRQSDEGYQTLK